MSYKRLIPKLLENRRLIIGLGSGRCGTCSLAHLLNLQEDTDITHEYHTQDDIFGIGLDSPMSLVLFCFMDILGRESKIIGDVGFYWLQYIKTIMAFTDNIRCVALKRDKEETISSYLRAPVQKRNPMHVYTREEFSRFYDEYYLRLDYYIDRYPDKFKLFNINCLDSEEGQREILNFAGFGTHTYEIGIKLNQTPNIIIELDEETGVEVKSQDNETGVFSDALQGGALTGEG